VNAHRDVVVIGGGHNGLVAAAYLAKSGLDVLVCERRPVVGGAAVSEHPFGPDYTVTSLSYVVSLLPPDLVTDLNLTRHGYHVFAQGPYFAPRADGRYLRLPDDPAQRHAEIAKFSAADADAWVTRAIEAGVTDREKLLVAAGTWKKLRWRAALGGAARSRSLLPLAVIPTRWCLAACW